MFSSRRRKPSRSVVLIVFLLKALSINAMAQQMGVVNRDAVSVSLVSILANPADHHGLRVRTTGVINVEFEGNALFLSREHRQYFIHSNAVWLDLEGMSFPSEDIVGINGEYVIVEGRVNAYSKGHMGIFVATLEDINRIDALEQVSRD